MGNTWKAKCVDSGTSKWNVGDVIEVVNGVGVKNSCHGWGGDSSYSVQSFENWIKFQRRGEDWSDWKLIEQEKIETLTLKEGIELLKEIFHGRIVGIDRMPIFKTLLYIDSVNDLFNKFSSQYIMERLIEYKKSKQIHIFTKQEYDDVVTTKLDELYPNGWKVEDDK